MPTTKLKQFLDSRDIRYVTIKHSRAYTAAEVAESAHVSGRDFAKTIIVWLDGRLAMVAVEANRRIVLSDLRELLGTEHVRLATEPEFKDAFPDCELGAMPPFGNLYNMPTYIAASLAEEQEIAFNAGTHTEVMTMSYRDYEDIVQPTAIDLVNR